MAGLTFAPAPAPAPVPAADQPKEDVVETYSFNTGHSLLGMTARTTLPEWLSSAQQSP